MQSLNKIITIAIIIVFPLVLSPACTPDDPGNEWMLAVLDGGGSSSGATETTTDPSTDETAAEDPVDTETGDTHDPFDSTVDTANNDNENYIDAEYSLDVTYMSGDEAFLFETNQEINVNFLIYTPDSTVDGSVVRITYTKDGANSVLFQAVPNQEGEVTGSFTINTATDEVTVSVEYGDVVLEKEVKIVFARVINGIYVFNIDLSDYVKPDADGDGVEDRLDDYPDDPARATLVKTPSEGFYTVAYEDLYPVPGDADFNDYVLKVRYEKDLNAQGEVVGLRGFYRHIARGAGYKHIPRLTLPEGTPGAQVDLINYDENLMFVSETKEDVERVEALSLLPDSSKTITSNNSEPTSTYVEGWLAELSVTFDTPVATSVLGKAPYDLYIHVLNTGKDIHFPGFLSDENGKDLYLDATGFPWALLVPGEWHWPYEQSDSNIHNAYENFDDWYMSLGQTNTDWYLYANDALVFPY